MNNLIEIKQLPIIEEQLKSVSDEIDKKVKKAKNLICTEESVKIIKQVRADLNKEFKELSHGFGAATGYSIINDAIKTISKYIVKISYILSIVMMATMTMTLIIVLIMFISNFITIVLGIITAIVVLGIILWILDVIFERD